MHASFVKSRKEMLLNYLTGALVSRFLSVLLFVILVLVLLAVLLLVHAHPAGMPGLVQSTAALLE